VAEGAAAFLDLRSCCCGKGWGWGWRSGTAPATWPGSLNAARRSRGAAGRNTIVTFQVPSVETFMQQYHMQCPMAWNRLVKVRAHAEGVRTARFGYRCWRG
jgi:hypothetical protein